MEAPTSLMLNPTVPYDPSAQQYLNFFGFVVPEVYHGWKPETLSWKKSCYLSGNLSYVMGMVRVKGPDALRMMNEWFVNNFTKMRTDAIRHGIMVTSKGNIIEHGIVVRLAEDEFGLYGFSPYINWIASTKGYDVELSTNEGGDFIYQLAGPTSLQIVENAAERDLHDLKFMRYVNVEIAGCPVRVSRQGMGGTLSYEVHGLAKYSQAVYGKLIEVGADYGIEKLGYLTYDANHTENGYPQIGEHFTYPFKDEPEFQEYLKSIGFFADPDNWTLHGSVEHDLDNYFCNPYEVGWGHMVKLDHDFHGRKALEKIAENHRTMVTLEWDPDDVVDVFASYFRDPEPYKEIKFPYNREESNFGTSVDRVVDAEDKQVGRSMFPTYTLYYRRLISLCPIDAALAEIGTKVGVVWGEPDGPQKLIHATVARFPYLDLPANYKYPVEDIPHYGA